MVSIVLGRSAGEYPVIQLTGERGYASHATILDTILQKLGDLSLITEDIVFAGYSTAGQRAAEELTEDGNTFGATSEEFKNAVACQQIGMNPLAWAGILRDGTPAVRATDPSIGVYDLNLLSYNGYAISPAAPGATLEATKLVEFRL